MTRSSEENAPSRGRLAGEGTPVTAVVAGAAATFGLVISSALMAVVVAGTLQWMNLPGWLDNAVPLVVLASGLLLSGRIAADVAGRYGPWCGVGAAILVGLVGSAVSVAGEAHGDGLEPTQIAVAVLVVMLLTSGGSWWIVRRRAGQGRSRREDPR